jgi:hypothetical protein
LKPYAGIGPILVRSEWLRPAAGHHRIEAPSAVVARLERLPVLRLDIGKGGEPLTRVRPCPLRGSTAVTGANSEHVVWPAPQLRTKQTDGGPGNAWAAGNVTLTVRAATRMAAAPAQNRQALPAACTD